MSNSLLVKNEVPCRAFLFKCWRHPQAAWKCFSIVVPFSLRWFCNIVIWSLLIDFMSLHLILFSALGLLWLELFFISCLTQRKCWLKCIFRLHFSGQMEQKPDNVFPSKTACALEVESFSSPTTNELLHVKKQRSQLYAYSPVGSHTFFANSCMSFSSTSSVDSICESQKTIVDFALSIAFIFSQPISMSDFSVFSFPSNSILSFNNCRVSGSELTFFSVSAAKKRWIVREWCHEQ